MGEEYLDLVDEKDQVIGRETRKNIYKKKRKGFVRVVNILVFNSKGELLLPKRTKKVEIFPGCWDFSCGEHVRSGETYHQAAIRGLKEELGISKVKLIPLGKLTPKDGVSCFMMVYKVVYKGKIKQYEKKSIASLRWVDVRTVWKMVKKHPEQFKSDFLPVLRWYLRKHPKRFGITRGTQ